MDSPLPESFWKDSGLSAEQELQLHFGIVACHASHLSHLFLRGASQLIQFQKTFRLLSKRLLEMSRISLDFYQFINDHSEINKPYLKHSPDLEKLISATSWTKGCIKQYQRLDSLCRVISPQARTMKFSWDKGVVEISYSGQNAVLARGSEADFLMGFLIPIENAETCLKYATSFYSRSRLDAISRYRPIWEGLAISCPQWQLNRKGAITRIDELLLNCNTKEHPQTRQSPRDIESELLQCHRLHTLSDETNSRPFPPTERSGSGRTNDLPLHAQRLVSINNGRPKKKHVDISLSAITFRRGDNILDGWVIKGADFLLVTRRETACQKQTLTLFIRAKNIVQSFEMGFDELEQLNIWHARLEALGRGYMSPKFPHEPRHDDVDRPGSGPIPS